MKKADMLIDAIGEIDEELLLSVDKLRQQALAKGTVSRNRRKLSRKAVTVIGSLAASFVIIISGGAYFMRGGLYMKNRNDAVMHNAASLDTSYSESMAEAPMQEEVQNVITDDIASDRIPEVEGIENTVSEEAVPERMTLLVEIQEVDTENHVLKAGIISRLMEENNGASDIFLPTQIRIQMALDWSMDYSKGERIKVSFDEYSVIESTGIASEDEEKPMLIYIWKVSPIKEPEKVVQAE